MIDLASITFSLDGDETALPLIVAHGLFGSAKNWRAHGKRLGPGRRTIAVDMRNHGESDWSDVHDYPAMAADLAGVIEREGGRAAVLGHSMGGKAAMVLAETRPELVERLIVADIAPVAYGHDLLEEIHAMRAVDLGQHERRSTVQAALTEILSSPSVAAFLAHSAVPEEGRWSLNLDALEANMAAISGYPDRGGRYGGPVLMLTGASSKYVTETHHPEINARFEDVSYQALEGAGHWLHADKPREFLDAANAFLAG